MYWCSRYGDGKIESFIITEYNESMSSFLGLSLTETGFTFCPPDDGSNNSDSRVVFKALPYPSQYVVPITYSELKTTKMCYPSSVTPQELSEIFTSGIKYATCYPIRQT